jgi:hypothetical protein
LWYAIGKGSLRGNTTEIFLPMKKSINVLLMEDNKYYNDLLSKALKSSTRFLRSSVEFNLEFYSFTDHRKCIRKIRSGALNRHDTIAFVDYYLGKGVNGDHIIKILKEANRDATAILISQSRAVEGKSRVNHHDYFVVKDATAPALCLLHLEQFIENKTAQPGLY